jgi:hypothetical protein
MVTIARPRFWLGLLLVTAMMLVCPPTARATRVDIDDPTLLGPVVRRQFIPHGNPFVDTAIAEVRYAAGIYSYVYAITASPDLPPTSCCEAFMLNYSITGHPLEETWGAINSSDVYWRPAHPGHTSEVGSITPIYDGFVVVPEGGLSSSGALFVVYMQSALRPALVGTFHYTGQVRDWDHGGVLRTQTYHRDGVLAPVPEPGSIVLFGLGLASLAAKRRTSRSRRLAVAPSGRLDSGRGECGATCPDVTG